MQRLVQIFSPWFVDMILATFAAVRWGKGWRTRCFPKGLQQTWQACSSCRIPSVDKVSWDPCWARGRYWNHVSWPSYVATSRAGHGKWTRFWYPDYREYDRQSSSSPPLYVDIFKTSPLFFTVSTGIAGLVHAHWSDRRARANRKIRRLLPEISALW